MAGIAAGFKRSVEIGEFTDIDGLVWSSQVFASAIWTVL